MASVGMAKETGFVETTKFGTENSSSDIPMQDVHGDVEIVEDKWQGNASDRHDMLVLGRAQVLRRNFSFISILGFGAVLICTWEIIFANLLFALTDGGTGGLFWGYTVTVIASVFIYLSIGEMASMSPTAGGQYHWVSEFSPRWCQKYLSYITGWLLATGWQGSVVGLSFLAGTIIQGLVVLNDTTYMPQRWHGTLLVIAVVAFCIIFNTSLAKKLPLIEGFILLIHVIGLFAIVVPLWVLSPRNDARTALLTFNNGGNWPTQGVSFMIGLLTSLGSMMGFDCSVHMSEEIKNAGETLPRSILWGVGLNAVLGYITVITLCFTVTDPTTVLNSATGYPFIQHFFDVTKSYAATDILTAIIIITLVSAVISEVATASRQIWSFARDSGLPFSPFLKRVNPGWNVPLNAVWVSFGFGVAISLINIGSTVALNAIISLTISALLGSYIVSIGCFLSKRLRKEPLPPAKFSLGKWGMPVNIIALIFLISFFIFCFFPTARPVTPQTMNWNIAMFSGITGFATIYYIIIGHKQYKPPVNLVHREL